MKIEMTSEEKQLIEEIDKLSHYEMCRLWRYASVGRSTYLSGIVGEYFKDRLFNHFKGFTPAISKSLSNY
jgi:hypothetical protein